jgi:hypothetical protein
MIMGWSPEMTPWKDEIRRVQVGNVLGTLHNSGAIYITGAGAGLLWYEIHKERETLQARFDELMARKWDKPGDWPGRAHGIESAPFSLEQTDPPCTCALCAKPTDWDAAARGAAWLMGD